MAADLLSTDEDSFSVIERLADAIRIEDDVRIGPEDRQRLVQDLYEGPKKCQCCVNWVSEIPKGVDVAAVKVEECPHPIIIRRRILPGESKAQVQIHSIEVCNPAVRQVLFRVFEGLDGIIPEVRYLVLRAPFHQFFWRWDRFEKAIEDEENEIVKAVLVQIRAIVKPDLAEAFAVAKELVPHGIITFKHLWILFPPGEIVHASDSYSKHGAFLETISGRLNPNDINLYQLTCRFIDWDGYRFGWAMCSRGLRSFRGTMKIADLNVCPERHLPGAAQETLREKCIARGHKFRELAGLKYKAYVDDEASSKGKKQEGQKNTENRIILDSAGHPSRQRRDPDILGHIENPPFYRTGLITQAPVDAAPAGGHIPLPTEDEIRMGRNGPRPPRPVYNYDDHDNYHPHMPPREREVPRRREYESDSESDSDSDDEEEDKIEFTDSQLQLCKATLRGYCLQDKDWDEFDVDRIRDIEWNPSPFDSLVLPEGYKDLILSFVENQLKDGDSFDDIVNGKGGGLVILLAGNPGVGKTMTAESVAEKINAPLVKIELSLLTETIMAQQATAARVTPGHRDYNSDAGENDVDDELAKTFRLASRWGAVLLIDECDMYLERRNDESPARNHVVSRFLRHLEYYPSLLFLTTNRERVLDPAVYSRIHLTINYPALDFGSRLQIWKTFLHREEGHTISEDEMEVLAGLSMNGRRIKNVTKTARIMAKRKGRGLQFSDVRNVIRITEGLEVVDLEKE
ncbi:putative nucleotidase [Podospora conica]|nr:putative nucleotidase [Schizothecium conicum]